MRPAIEQFIVEMREAGKVRGLLTEAHVEYIRDVLTGVAGAAEDHPVLWRYALEAISRRDLTVKARLEQLGVVGDVFQRAYRKRLPATSDTAH
jgi:hypothetical protein